MYPDPALPPPDEGVAFLYATTSPSGNNSTIALNIHLWCMFYLIGYASIYNGGQLNSIHATSIALIYEQPSSAWLGGRGIYMSRPYIKAARAVDKLMEFVKGLVAK